MKIKEIEERKIEREFKDTKTIVVLPAFNAAKTLKKTFSEIPKELIGNVLLVDDASSDNTVELAEKLGLFTFTHSVNKGYGANQKTCYTKALELEADIVVMLHPDYQYDPKIIPQLIEPIKEGKADAVFGSRMMGGKALEGGMPHWKYYANIIITAIENFVLGIHLTEYHSGFRAYSAKLLRSINFQFNSNGFVFDTEIIIQAILQKFKIEEISIPTRYLPESSTIKFWPAVVYGLGILKALFKYYLHTHNIIKFKQFE